MLKRLPPTLSKNRNGSYSMLVVNSSIKLHGICGSWLFQRSWGEFLSLHMECCRAYHELCVRTVFRSVHTRPLSLVRSTTTDSRSLHNVSGTSDDSSHLCVCLSLLRVLDCF